MACNNTTYFQMLMNNSDLLNELYKTSYYVGILNHNIPVAMQVNKIVTPIWLVVGIFGNIISAIVWANPRMRTCNTAAYYLTCLSIADLTFLILCFIYELENPWLLSPLDLTGWCQIFQMANIAVQYFCVFLVFAFTAERFLSMWFPFKSERFGKTRTPRIIMGLMGVAVALSLPQLYFWDIHPIVGECQLRSTLSKKSEVSFFSLYTWCTELAVFGVLPLVVLFLNTAVLYKIRNVGKLNLGSANHHSSRSSSSRIPTEQSTSLLQSDKAGKDANQSRTNGGAKSNSSSASTTATLLGVAFFLILTMLPNTLLYAMQEMVNFGPMPCRVEDMSSDPKWRDFFAFTSVKVIVKEISLSHHVGNVFIYMATSRRFLQLAVNTVLMRSNKASADTSLHTIRIANTRTVGDGV
ncbi:thyrotropin-releasing hormone receptor-like [Elysia marginata]|uniref:Thyrotropin-releasing hormone receptor-like n=1 Tax=Elysia marginata TaxID=1093978 RepID=A0AAV4IBV1_9GAST|nr:thyrotropin-releasing hormone receptor-like [Elysia marginata]